MALAFWRKRENGLSNGKYVDLEQSLIKYFVCVCVCVRIMDRLVRFNCNGTNICTSIGDI